MNQLKHTPGEWLINRLDKYSYRLCNEQGDTIGEIYSSHISSDEVKQNVVLAAAAPTMLEALIKINNMSPEKGRAGCDYSDTDYDSLSVCYGYNLALEYMKEIAQSAITKATKP